MRSISIYTSMLAFLAAMACGACQRKSAPATAGNLQSESPPPKPVTPAGSTTTSPPTVQKGKRATALKERGGEGKDREENDTDRRAAERRPVPQAAPPPTAGLSAGPALKLDRTTAHVGDTISVARSEPFPSGATVHFGDTEAKPVKRLDGGRKLSFKVPKSAQSGPVTVKVDGEAYTSEALTIE